jgi:hypothetical protein
VSKKSRAVHYHYVEKVRRRTAGYAPGPVSLLALPRLDDRHIGLEGRMRPGELERTASGEG